MKFERRSDLVGKHAMLSPSQYHWLNYDDQKLHARFVSAMRAARGTALHNLAEDLINLGVHLPEVPETLNMYVNDCIEHEMQCEVPFVYSPNCFGHADAANFDSQELILRVWDLKTGIEKASMTQLEVYVAIFCLQYQYSPYDLEFDLRIYQNDQIVEHSPYPDRIDFIMEKIVDHDNKIEDMRKDLGA